MIYTTKSNEKIEKKRRILRKREKHKRLRNRKKKQKPNDEVEASLNSQISTSHEFYFIFF